MIVETLLPYTPIHAVTISQRLHHQRLESIDAQRKAVSFTELKQAMPMIRHHNPAQGPSIAPCPRLMAHARCGNGGIVGSEDALAWMSGTVQEDGKTVVKGRSVKV